MRPTITLFRQAGHWLAQHSDPTVREMFGTDTLPTAWADDTPARMVFARVAQLNPDAKVFVRVSAG